MGSIRLHPLPHNIISIEKLSKDNFRLQHLAILLKIGPHKRLLTGHAKENLKSIRNQSTYHKTKNKLTVYKRNLTKRISRYLQKKVNTIVTVLVEKVKRVKQIL